MKNFKGITLTSLVITVIVMVILAVIALLFSVGEEGIIQRTNESKKRTELADFKEKLSMEYMAIKNNPDNKDKSITKRFELLQGKMGFNANFIGSGGMIIEYDKNTFLTLLEDGRIIDGKKIELNIADGNIDILSKGYKQNNGELVEYPGDYIITGNTDEYYVRVIEKGNYNITIKDLNIDLSINNGGCPLNLNAANAKTDLNVKLNIEGNNYLASKWEAGIGFSKATPNIGEITNGSTLIIEGTGSVYVKGGSGGAGIGGGMYYYSVTCGNVANIIINSGNITAVAGTNGCAIGGGLNEAVSNIIINGGNINAIASNRFGIGSSRNTLNNLVINGGNITANQGEYGGVLGGNPESGKIVINGGILNLKNNHSTDATFSCKGLEINGGIINIESNKGRGIGSNNTLPFLLNVTDGEINDYDKICSKPVNLLNSKLYLTKIKLGELVQQIKIDNIQVSNNIEYEIENLYTSRDGHLYIFLPEGEVTVSVIVGEKTYTGTVTVTPENTEVFTLTQN